jgi:hypothetical protein
MLFPVRLHPQVWQAYGPISAATMRRAAGWAIHFGALILHTRLTEDPVFAQVGRVTLERACAG